MTRFDPSEDPSDGHSLPSLHPDRCRVGLGAQGCRGLRMETVVRMQTCSRAPSPQDPRGLLGGGKNWGSRNHPVSVFADSPVRESKPRGFPRALARQAKGSSAKGGRSSSRALLPTSSGLASFLSEEVSALLLSTAPFRSLKLGPRVADP